MTDAFKCNDRVGELEGVDISPEVNIWEVGVDWTVNGIIAKTPSLKVESN